MTSSAVRQAISLALKEIGILTPFTLSYGTAGFRCPAPKLKGVSMRVGVLAALRSILKGGKFVGVMITASHNPAADNGIKIVDADGGMLETSWEPIIVDFMHCSASETVDWIEKKVENSDTTLHPRVVVGYDTRESSPSLAQEIVNAVELMQGSCIQLGLVTTPQLHFAVHHLNSLDALELSDDILQINLNKIYTQHFVDIFCAGIAALPAGNNRTKLPVQLNVDCAHGVGSLALQSFNKALAGHMNFSPLQIRLFNTQVNKKEMLNFNCGADFVKLTSKAPALYPIDDSPPCSPNDRWATIDGDADRLLYFFHENRPNPLSSLNTPPVVLLDGDRIACLFASFVIKVLQQSCLTDKFRVGVVQTAYANASSTLYLRDELKVTVLCVPTGVKHLHRAAMDFDFGIYFEANGHGTVLFSDSVINHVRSYLEPHHPLSVFVNLANPTIGDAITDILLVEFVLAWHGWSLKQWYEMYKELASKQIKVKVNQPSTILTTDAERRICSPLALQDEIDKLVNSVEQATKSPGKSRAFVRPSGTENIARVYAESIDQQWADWLANKVALETYRLIGGPADSRPTDPGPMPH